MKALYFFYKAARGSWGPYIVRRFLDLIHRNRLRTNNVSLGHGSSSSSEAANKIGYGFSMNQGLRMFSTNGGTWGNLEANKVKMIKDDKNDMVRLPEPNPSTPIFNFSTWAKWVWGSALTLLLSFWKQKLEKLKMIEGKAENVMDEVEHVAAAVEKTATVVEHISAEVAEELPDNGKLKEAALLVERISKATARDAQIIEVIIHKVDESKHNLGESKHNLGESADGGTCNESKHDLNESGDGGTSNESKPDLDESDDGGTCN